MPTSNTHVYEVFMSRQGAPRGDWSTVEAQAPTVDARLTGYGVVVDNVNVSVFA